MERIHVYKTLPDYGHGLLGGINLYSLEMLFDGLGLMFSWCNEDYTECEITKEDLDIAIEKLKNENCDIPHIFEQNGYNREEIADCLTNFRDEADASEDYIKLTIF
jgi:hypothetical protein